MATLKNEGKTCYINSIVQMLLSDQEFMICLNKEQYKRIIDVYKKGSILSIIEFLNYYKSLNSSFKLGEDGDSDECLTYLLDDLSDKSLFQVKIKQSTHVRKELLNLENDIPTVEYSFEISETITNENFLSVPLKESLQESINSLFIQKDQEIYNEDVNGVIEQRYSPKIEYEPYNSPKFLFIHLKRFDFERRLKLEDEIIIHNYIVYFGMKYEVISYIIHIGDFNRGHYIAIKKYEGKWILFDDNRLNELNNQEDGIKIQSIGYIFLLKRIDDPNFNEEQIIKHQPQIIMSKLNNNDDEMLLLDDFDEFDIEGYEDDINNVIE